MDMKISSALTTAKIAFLIPGWFLFCCPLFAQQAELISLSGDVKVKLQGIDEYTSAREGMALEAGDKIKSASNASCELSFNQANTNLVRLSENSSAEITFSQDEKIELTEGEIFASISDLPSGSNFEIRTPTAVSGARGTDWVTKVTDQGTDIEAVDDQPYVRHFESSGQLARQPTFIRPGQMTTVRKFQPPAQFRPMAEERRQKWLSTRQDVRSRGDQAFQKRPQQKPFDREQFKRELREKRNSSVFKPLDGEKQDPESGYKPFTSREKDNFSSVRGFPGPAEGGENLPETLRSFEQDRSRQDPGKYKTGKEFGSSGKDFQPPEKAGDRKEAGPLGQGKKPANQPQEPKFKEEKPGIPENNPAKQGPRVNGQDRPRANMPGSKDKRAPLPR